MAFVSHDHLNVIDEATLVVGVQDRTYAGIRTRTNIYDYTKNVGNTIKVSQKQGGWTFIAGETQEQSLQNRRRAEQAYAKEKARRDCPWIVAVEKAEAQANFLEDLYSRMKKASKNARTMAVMVGDMAAEYLEMPADES